MEQSCWFEHKAFFVYSNCLSGPQSGSLVDILLHVECHANNLNKR